jgi:hypothetical protein
MGIIGHSIGFMESWAINRKSATSAASLFRLERDAISTRRYELRWTLSIGPPARINRLSIRVVKAGHRFQHLLSPGVLSCLGTPLPPCRLDRQAAAMAEGLKSGESKVPSSPVEGPRKPKRDLIKNKCGPQRVADWGLAIKHIRSDDRPSSKFEIRRHLGASGAPMFCDQGSRLFAMPSRGTVSQEPRVKPRCWLGGGHRN